MKELNDDYLLDDDDEILEEEIQQEDHNDYYDEHFNDDDSSDQDEFDRTEDEEDSSDEPIEESDQLNMFLMQKGINPHAVIYENEDGEEEEVNFYDLSLEEQMNILDYKQDDYDLDDEEVNVINFLRENDINLEDYTEYIKQKAIDEYLSENQTYSVEDYDDDTIYTSYLQNQYDNLTEDEIAFEIEKEKEHPELYAKKVEKIREYYKEQEALLESQTEQERKAREELELNEIKDEMTRAAVSTNDFMGFELEDEDRRETLRFIFEKDATGKSKFYKMFDNPEKLFRIALFALKEDEIHNTINYEMEKLAKSKTKVVEVSAPVQPKKNKVVVASNSSKPSSGDQHRFDDGLLNKLL